MTSLCNTREDDYLDAARECVLDLGWRRTTLTEVARRAGVSRMTLYRTWPDVDRMMSDLMTREFGELVALATADDHDLANAVSQCVIQLRNNPLLRQILKSDPELILPYLTQRPGRFQAELLTRISDIIRTGQEAGTVRAGSPYAIATGVLLLAHGFTLSAHTMLDDDVSEAALNDELHHLLTRHLQP